MEIVLRRAQFQAFEVGMKVEVGVRRGALQIPRVPEIRER